MPAAAATEVMKNGAATTSELGRLAEDAAGKRGWREWGTYLAERQWATVREDHFPQSDCGSYLPHDHARSRTSGRLITLEEVARCWTSW